MKIANDQRLNPAYLEILLNYRNSRQQSASGRLNPAYLEILLNFEAISFEAVENGS